eukprot:1242776-Pleurochrysis_carterae.AAC.2
MEPACRQIASTLRPGVQHQHDQLVCVPRHSHVRTCRALRGLARGAFDIGFAGASVRKLDLVLNGRASKITVRCPASAPYLYRV